MASNACWKTLTNDKKTKRRNRMLMHHALIHCQETLNKESGRVDAL
jgi:predicted nucleic acid-binding Zn ribbon protein